MHDQPTMTDPPRRQSSSSGDKDHINHKKMAAQSQGIKQLMAAEKEAAQVVANARKSKGIIKCMQIRCRVGLRHLKRTMERALKGVYGSLVLRESTSK